MDAQGLSDVKAIYDSGSTQLRARFESRLHTLAQRQLNEWREPLIKDLRGRQWAGLMEIRFKADNVQQRLLGHRTGNREFTILFWATEKGGKFVPRSACVTARNRKAEVSQNRGRTNELWLALE